MVSAPVKSKSKNWFLNMIWADNSLIEDSVKKYAETKWYKSPRYWILLWGIIATIISGLIQTGNTTIDIIAGTLIICAVFMALSPFIIKGYIFPFVLLILFKIYDMVLTLAERPRAAMSILIFGAIWIGICITSIRIEVLRNKTQKIKRRFWKDLLYSFSILIAGGALAVGLRVAFEPAVPESPAHFQEEYFNNCYNGIKDSLQTPEHKANAEYLCRCLAKFMADNVDLRTGDIIDGSTVKELEERAVKHCIDGLKSK